MKRLLPALAGLALVVAPATASAQNPSCTTVAGNLVQNCSFETPTLNPGAAYPNAPLDNWTSSNGTYERWTGAYGGFASRDGNSHVELNVNVPTTLSQYLTTSIGQRYDLFFSAAHRAGGPAQFSQIDVYVDNVFVTSTGQLSGSQQWVDFSADFVAMSTNALIEFRGQGAGSYGNHLDNVAVAAAVPEPSTAALLLIGGALVAGARRRTRRA